jgi:hypothetical protein
MADHYNFDTITFLSSPGPDVKSMGDAESYLVSHWLLRDPLEIVKSAWDYFDIQYSGKASLLKMPPSSSHSIKFNYI